MYVKREKDRIVAYTHTKILLCVQRYFRPVGRASFIFAFSIRYNRFHLPKERTN